MFSPFRCESLARDLHAERRENDVERGDKIYVTVIEILSMKDVRTGCSKGGKRGEDAELRWEPRCPAKVVTRHGRGSRAGPHRGLYAHACGFGDSQLL